MKVACFGAHICKIMGIEDPILNCGSCLRSTVSCTPGDLKAAETSGRSTQMRVRPTYSNSLRRRGGHGRQGTASLRDATTPSQWRPAFKPAWRRATAGRDLRVFSGCVSYCRIRPALTVLHFSAAGCPGRVCRNPYSIFSLFWILPPHSRPGGGIIIYRTQPFQT